MNDKDGLNCYIQTCKKVEQKKKKPARLLFAVKKLFSIPWLIIGEYLMNNYPREERKMIEDQQIDDDI